MPKFSPADFLYAAAHPLRALRYSVHRDGIPYAVCAKYLPSDPVIVEAGAFDGTNTREFCRHWPRCRVYAFEPVADAYARLASVAAEFPGRVFPQPLALGDRNSQAEMHVSFGGAGVGEQSSSLLAPAATTEEFPFVRFRPEKVEVKVTRLDQWAVLAGVVRVDFLWFDLQGMELAALEGCGELLQTVGAIHCEVQNIPLYKDAPLYPTVRAWLSARGFRVVREAVFRRGGNVLFARA